MPLSFRSAVLLAALALAFTAGIAGAKDASVVNAAPSFVGGASAGRNISLSSLRGKPVVLLIATSPRDRSFRRQMGELRGTYERLAAQGILCFAAFISEGGPPIRSNIPFILINDPAATASAYDIQKGFAIAVIGRDGNLDCLSTKPLPGYRILDLIMNNAGMQEQLRR
ncbi:MAG: redoxin domain-containing protein [Verrucomicrobia bacterium]|nr:redoxin domain-containing protein [Verrucomicrobiota bacterium]